MHLAFLNPSQLTRQYSMMPDGTTYFCFAKVQLQPIGGSIVRGTAYSIGLGTHAENAQFLAYGLPTTDLQRDAVPTGISCRFCERTDCNQRAAASYRFAFSFDEYTKKDCFFSPLLVHEAGKDAGHAAPARRGLTHYARLLCLDFALASGAPGGTRRRRAGALRRRVAGPNGTDARAIDRRSPASCSAPAREEGFRGEPDQTFVLHTHGRLPAARVVLVGTGAAERCTPNRCARRPGAG